MDKKYDTPFKQAFMNELNKLTLKDFDKCSNVLMLINKAVYSKSPIDFTQCIPKSNIINKDNKNNNVVDDNYEWAGPNLTIPEISDGLYDGKVITTQGTISDYFDITVYNGPHAITIEDENYNELELTIWPDYWDDTLAEYASCPYSRYEVEVTGIVNEYCKDTCNNFTTEISCNADDDCMWDGGNCIEEDCEVKYTSQAYCDADSDCIWDEDDGECGKDCTLNSNWECSSLSRSISYETANEYDGEYYLADGFLQECSWQLEVSGISGIELVSLELIFVYFDIIRRQASKDKINNVFFILG